MGAGASAQGGKLAEGTNDIEAFKKSLEEAWAYNDGEQQQDIVNMLKAAQKFVGEKRRELSVGKIDYPPANEKLEELWKLCDYNGNGFSSLAELDKMIVENFPEYDNKPAVMRAYQCIDRNNNGFISKREFRDFFGYLDYFTKLWDKFESIDDDNDRRISYEEMKRHSKEIFGRELSEESATILFHSLDRNNGGKILFYEWVAYQAALDRKDFTIDKLPFE
ncbi:Calmodulin [Hondaea fermentalgiana]|uniref:Calmodulin n=1 Tax=Hondaea fermentalgiana TaxID=2315210 RepID=A0A2R5GKV5_9STRA|nr:Calmodulin [Hondaea fermentalgiana]|eukprot:GBG28504.1 Calmodulin [Hondaea fermentalgiana]